MLYCVELWCIQNKGYSKWLSKFVERFSTNEFSLLMCWNTSLTQAQSMRPLPVLSLIQWWPFPKKLVISSNRSSARAHFIIVDIRTKSTNKHLLLPLHDDLDFFYIMELSFADHFLIKRSFEFYRFFLTSWNASYVSYDIYAHPTDLFPHLGVSEIQFSPSWFSWSMPPLQIWID